MSGLVFSLLSFFPAWTDRCMRRETIWNWSWTSKRAECLNRRSRAFSLRSEEKSLLNATKFPFVCSYFLCFLCIITCNNVTCKYPFGGGGEGCLLQLKLHITILTPVTNFNSSYIIQRKKEFFFVYFNFKLTQPQNELQT